MALALTAAEERKAIDLMSSREMGGKESRCSRIHAHYNRSHSIEVADCVDCEAISAFLISTAPLQFRNTSASKVLA